MESQRTAEPQTIGDKISIRCSKALDCREFQCGLGKGLDTQCYGSNKPINSCYTPEDEDTRQ